MSLLPIPNDDTLRALAAERTAKRASQRPAAASTSRQTARKPDALPLPFAASDPAVAGRKSAKTKGRKKGRGTKRAPQPPVRALAGPLELVIPGIPTTKKNSPELAINQRTGKPFVVASPQYRRWARVAKPPLATFAQARGSIAEPVCLTATIYRARRVGDLVNYLQAACDLLEDAGVLEDDKWVEAFDGSRLACDPANPRVELTLTPMEMANAA